MYIPLGSVLLGSTTSQGRSFVHSFRLDIKTPPGIEFPEVSDLCEEDARDSDDQKQARIECVVEDPILLAPLLVVAVEHDASHAGGDVIHVEQGADHAAHKSEHGSGVALCSDIPQEGHHHHHADDVFSTFGIETAKKFTKEELEAALAKLSDEAYGTVLRAKGIVAGEGVWYHFDFVPEEYEVRTGSADVTGRMCVIGAKLAEDKIKTLFGV